MGRITKKIRFEVFKRDEFTCTYCGQKPPAVVLEVDHVIPVARGGQDAIENLTTSCDLVFTDRFRLSVKHFLEKLSIDRVTFAAERAYQKVRAPDPRLKYFCGICWKLIKEP